MAHEKATSLYDDKEASSSTTNTNDATFSNDVERQSGDQGDGTSHLPTEAAPKDPNIVGWEVDDPENPLNWNSWKKVGVVVVVAFITMLS